ncbi:MAG: mercuric reductase [Rhodospirillales bacterium]|nr:mercuric reductase [Rhodospirillales bacterium]
MTDFRNTRASTPPAEAGRDAAKTTLATGALVAAFGVASCCALPVALAALGIGSAGLFAIAALVGPYQLQILAGAVICLLGAAVLMWRQRRARACGTAGTRRRPVLDRITQVALVLALGLLVLTFWMEPPL